MTALANLPKFSCQKNDFSCDPNKVVKRTVIGFVVQIGAFCLEEKKRFKISKMKNFDNKLKIFNLLFRSGWLSTYCHGIVSW